MAKKPVVLLIHGMGTHSDQSVKDEFKVGLEKCMEFFGYKNFDVNSEFTLKTFNYSEYWDEKRKAFAEHLNGEIKESLSLTPQLIQSIYNVIDEFDNDDFLHTHLVDVLFYLTSVLREHQLVKLHKVFAEAIKDNINDLNDDPLIVVAHSLGTAFIHDCLTQVYSKHLDPSVFALDQLWSVATVSRLTQMITQKHDPMKSIVTDHSESKLGVCKSFFPVYNEFDPFCWFKRYDRMPNAGVLIETKHVRDLKKIYGSSESMRINPHDLREYFADPAVGGRFLARNGVLKIDMNDFTAAQARYSQTTLAGSINGSVDKIKAELKLIEEQSDGFNGMKKKVETLTRVFELIDEIRDEFKGT
ncbi:hypothetical protein ABGI61_00070 [Rheinheimera sp. FR7-31]|uniref:hypothetical protein n=1 Tax=Rheinheimera fenheensis TaxID=3152295 RepID=UPI00325F5556